MPFFASSDAESSLENNLETLAHDSSDWKERLSVESIFYFESLEWESHKLKKLKINGQLSLSAQKKAQDMAEREYFGHKGPAGEDPWKWIENENYSYLIAGENLAVNFISPEKAVIAWMNSPSHRENLLNEKFTETGIGISQGYYKNKKATYIVQFFAAPM